MELSDRLSMEDPFAADRALEDVQDAVGLLVDERLAHWSAREGSDASWVESEAGRHTLQLIQVAIAVSEGLAAMRELIVSGSAADSGDDAGIFP
jgi:hypothetical protein